jgi:hypothetical protein
MANTVVTSTTNSIIVVFNDDSSKVGMTKGTWSKSDISQFHLWPNHVEVVERDAPRWVLSYTTNTIGALIVDSVNGATPSSLDYLYTKLIALIASEILWLIGMKK